MPVPTFNAGDQLYKYQLQQHIGGGNFGQVWLAHDLTLARDVAIKILDESMSSVAENLNEAKVGNRLEHANVVHVHYADVVDTPSGNVVAIAMDFHPKGCATTQLNPSNFMPMTVAVRITIDILRGLEYLHESGLFHNDIKPSNILIGTRGEGILTDYGISCSSPDLKPAKAPSAYLLHKAPDTIADGNITLATDIYQVGLTLFRLLNGVGTVRELRNSLGNKSFEDLKAKGRVPRKQDYLPFIPPSLSRIITKATKADPHERYRSALEMRRALEAISLGGYWTTDGSGNYLGVSGDQTFRFTREKMRHGYKFNAFRTRLTTGSENRVAKMSGSNLSKEDFEKHRKDFMLAVVNGEL
ncbi:Serine/threonine-protein kinase PknD [Xanthomonas arboricola]|uniref:serine/threonine-protein kinase n=1 Tax=Xanthomonas arboricola TaxID=56448 RepID=UPI001E3CE553|nr:serine/threonine-protein kinase [Xanthomonas arboricola]CAE6689798.1 Serine/threonine-protein kinase PknD [Xanthomonas arboricola]CAE6689808.1 Serine/threonine-protein kinase PknD [Xanthomonas arboricola]